MRWTLAIFALVASCARTGVASVASGCPVAAHAAPASDSVRGVIDVVGSEPGTSVVITPSGERAVTLDGERQLLLQMQGLEVAVFGTRAAAGHLRVQSALVRASAGIPAADGILRLEPAGAVLVTCDGRRLRIGRLPEALRGAAGQRIWLAGSLDGPDSFGVVKE